MRAAVPVFHGLAFLVVAMLMGIAGAVLADVVLQIKDGSRVPGVPWVEVCTPQGMQRVPLDTR